MGEESFYELVSDLVSSLLDDHVDKIPTNERTLKRAKNKALETFLTYPQLSASSSSSISSSSSFNSRALTDLFSVVWAISEEERIESEEISAYHLVPSEPETTLFHKISDLVSELDATGSHPYGAGGADRRPSGGGGDASPSWSRDDDDDDCICAKTILFLSALANPPRSSSSSFSSSSSSIHLGNNNTQHLPSLSSQSFYCSGDLLRRRENIFSADPGYGSKFFSESSIESSGGDPSSRTLFRALTRQPFSVSTSPSILSPSSPIYSSSSSSSPFANQKLLRLDLQLPDLPADSEAFAESASLLPSHLRHRHPPLPKSESEDEGFLSGAGTPFLGFPDYYSDDDDDDNGEAPAAGHFLSEAGPETFDKLENVIKLPFFLHGDGDGDSQREISESHFVTTVDLLESLRLLLLGCESPLFQPRQPGVVVVSSATSVHPAPRGVFSGADDPSSRVRSLPGLRVSGLDSASLERFLEPYLNHFNYVRNVLELGDGSPNETSVGARGLVYQALLTGIRRNLQYARAFLVDLDVSRFSLLQFNAIVAKYMKQIETIADVCRVKQNLNAHRPKGTHLRVSELGSTSSPFPMGMDLLGYLYEKALAYYVHSAEETYPLLMSLFLGSLSPYVHFATHWVFFGQCRDRFGEFCIKPDDRFLSCRDRRYWTKGFVLTRPSSSPSPSSSFSYVPDFLSPLVNEIFSCGKAINLLRLCDPRHHVSALESDVDIRPLLPTLTLTLDEGEMSRTHARCRLYAAAMDQLADERRKRKRESEWEAAEEEARRRRGMGDEPSAVARMKSLEERVKARESLVRERKRRELEELKRGAEEARERKSRERLQERRSDARFAAEYDATEIGTRQKEDEELEAKVKEEMIGFYAELMAEAEGREKLAVWKLRRIALDEKRKEFWKEEREAWRKEGEEREAEEERRREEERESSVAKLPSWATAKVLRDRKGGDDDDGARLEDDEDQDEDEDDEEEKSVGVNEEREAESWAAEPPSDSGIGSGAPPLPALATCQLPSWAAISADSRPDESPPPIQVVGASDETLEDVVTPNDTPTHASQTSVAGVTLATGPLPATTPSHSTEEATAYSADDPTAPARASPSSSAATFRKMVEGRHVSAESDEFCLSRAAPQQQQQQQQQQKQQPVAYQELNDGIEKDSKNDSSFVANPAFVASVSSPGSCRDDSSSTSTAILTPTTPPPPLLTATTTTATATTTTTTIVVGSKPQTLTVVTNVIGQSRVENSTLATSRVEPSTTLDQSGAEESESKTSKRDVTRPPLDQSGKRSEDADCIHHETRIGISPNKRVSDESSSQSPVPRPWTRGSIALGHPSAQSPSSSFFPSNVKEDDDDDGGDDDDDHRTRGRGTGDLKNQGGGGGGGRITGEKGERRVRMQHPSYSTIQDRIYPTDRVKIVDDDGGRSEVKNWVTTTATTTTTTTVAAVAASAAASYATKTVTTSSLGFGKNRNSKNGSPDGRTYGFVEGLGRHYDGEMVGRLLEANVTRLTRRFPSFSLVVGADFLSAYYYGGHFSPELGRRERGSSSTSSDVADDDDNDEERRVRERASSTESPSQTKSNAASPRTSGVVNLTLRTSDESPEDQAALLGSYLPFVLQRCISEPLRTQISLVDSAVVDYFREDLEILRHFSALRQFLLMEDGEFSQRLSDQLFDRIAASKLGAGVDVLNPVVLNNILKTSLRFSSRVSNQEQDSLHEILSFAINPDLVEGLNLASPKSLCCLEFRYSVTWPLNIIITDSTLAKYAKLFTFMLQLKQAVWCLKDVFHCLKKVGQKSCTQVHQLQLYRHEMLHFVTVMQNFIANQVILNCWNEFLDKLEKVRNVDGLHAAHADYLNAAILRCLLNDKAARVMEIIQGIFALITKFRGQLLAYPISSIDEERGRLNFPALEETFHSYTKHSQFLFRAVSKLAEARYQPHLQDFIERLNFNEFYQRKKQK